MNRRFENAIFKHPHQGVLLVDAKSCRILRTNDSFAAMVGRSQADLAETVYESMVHPDDLRNGRIELAKLSHRADSSVGISCRYVRPDGSHVWSRTVITRIRGTAETSAMLLIMVEDLTHLRAVEERLSLSTMVSGAVIEGTTRYQETMEELVSERTRDLIAARDEAESASRAKSAFLATVSHELRTPLNAIIGFSSLLLEDPPMEDLAEQHKQLTIIRESGEQLLTLVREILDLTSIEAGRLSLQICPLRLRDVINDQVRCAQAEASSRGLDLTVEDCDESIMVLADAQRVGQVIRNLLANAIKFTDAGRVSVRAVVAGDKARIEVEDTGVGIAPERHTELFMPFQRIEESGAALRPGTGLGLAISRRLVEAMGGTIGLESQRGIGSRFWFAVPLAATRTLTLA
jgi:PAS domain S-box-containing protein